MLTEAFPYLHPRAVANSLPTRLRSLADDLDRIQAGDGPWPGDLATAPTITDWRCALTSAGLRLDGFVMGHPRLGDGRTFTSQLWAADPDGRWVRTLSRFYILGRPSFETSMFEDGRRADDLDGGL
jgi:hypothetical protein